MLHSWILKNWLTKRQLIRFIEFSLVGMLSFLVDLGLMGLFIYLLGVHYILGAVIAFVLATIFNYSLNRFWSFSGTKTGPIGGYFKFFALATINIGVIAGLLYFFVEILWLQPLPARAIAGLMLFLSNYILNSIFIFKIFPIKKSNKNAKK